MWRIRRIATRAPQSRLGIPGDGLGRLDVLLVSLLIALQLLLLDRRQTRAQQRRSLAGSSDLVLDLRDLQRKLRVVRALPRQPIGAASRVRRLQILLGERERPASRLVELFERLGKLPAAGLDDAGTTRGAAWDPAEQRPRPARMSLTAGGSRRPGAGGRADRRSATARRQSPRPPGARS